MRPQILAEKFSAFPKKLLAEFIINNTFAQVPTYLSTLNPWKRIPLMGHLTDKMHIACTNIYLLSDEKLRNTVGIRMPEIQITELFYYHSVVSVLVFYVRSSSHFPAKLLGRDVRAECSN